MKRPNRADAELLLASLLDRGFDAARKKQLQPFVLQLAAGIARVRIGNGFSSNVVEKWSVELLAVAEAQHRFFVLHRSPTTVDDGLCAVLIAHYLNVDLLQQVERYERQHLGRDERLDEIRPADEATAEVFLSDQPLPQPAPGPHAQRLGASHVETQQQRQQQRQQEEQQHQQQKEEQTP